MCLNREKQGVQDRSTTSILQQLRGKSVKKIEHLKFYNSLTFVLHKGYNENFIYSSCQAEQQQKEKEKGKEKVKEKEKAKPPGKTFGKDSKGKKSMATPTIKKDTKLKHRGQVEVKHKYIGM